MRSKDSCPVLRGERPSNGPFLPDWNLPRDYPMVAAAYAEQRKELAKKIGLGRKGSQSATKVKAPAGADALKKDRARPAKPKAEPAEA